MRDKMGPRNNKRRCRDRRSFALQRRGVTRRGLKEALIECGLSPQSIKPELDIDSDIKDAAADDVACLPNGVVEGANTRNHGPKEERAGAGMEPKHRKTTERASERDKRSVRA